MASNQVCHNTAILSTLRDRYIYNQVLHADISIGEFCCMVQVLQQVQRNKVLRSWRHVAV